MIMLTGDEIAALAQRMVECTDPAEAIRIREEIVRGFYGAKTGINPNPDLSISPCSSPPPSQ
jgi:hypothetical protein